MKASCAYPELLDIALLDGLPLQVRSDFLDRCKLRYCSEQTTILTQSEHTSGLFIIARGRVAVTYLGPDGHMSVIHVAMMAALAPGSSMAAVVPPSPALDESMSKQIAALRSRIHKLKNKPAAADQ